MLNLPIPYHKNIINKIKPLYIGSSVPSKNCIYIWYMLVGVWEYTFSCLWKFGKCSASLKHLWWVLFSARLEALKESCTLDFWLGPRCDPEFLLNFQDWHYRNMHNWLHKPDIIRPIQSELSHQNCFDVAKSTENPLFRLKQCFQGKWSRENDFN